MQAVGTLLGKIGRQYAACFIINLLSFTAGVYDFSVPLKFDEHKLQAHTVSTAKYYLVAKIIAGPFFGYFINAVGRKKMLIVVAASFLLQHILTFNAENDILDFFAGIGCMGAFVTVPIYTGEIAEDNKRGVLGCYFYLFFYSGRCFIRFHRRLAPRDKLLLSGIKSLPIITLLVSVWLPETPLYLLACDKKEEAFKALRIFRVNDEFIDEEFENLVISVKKVKARSFTTAKALFILYVLFVVRRLSFLFIVTTIHNRFLPKTQIVQYLASTSLLSSPVFLALDLGGGIAAIVLVERLGRKLLLLISSFGIGTSLLCLFMYSKMSSHFEGEQWWHLIDWIPPMSYGICIISYSFGIGPVPFVLVSEIFNVKTRGPAISFYFFVHHTVYLLLNYKITYFTDTMIIVWALNGLIIAIFIHLLLPETKGRPLAKILKKLGRNNKINGSVE